MDYHSFFSFVGKVMKLILTFNLLYTFYEFLMLMLVPIFAPSAKQVTVKQLDKLIKDLSVINPDSELIEEVMLVKRIIVNL